MEKNNQNNQTHYLFGIKIEIVLDLNLNLPPPLTYYETKN